MIDKFTSNVSRHSDNADLLLHIPTFQSIFVNVQLGSSLTLSLEECPALEILDP